MAKRLTKNQRTKLNEYIACDCDAGKMTSYKDKNVARSAMCQLLNRPNVREAFEKALEKKGFGVENLADGLLGLTDAKHKSYFPFQGKVISEREDPNDLIRLRALELIGRFLGLDRRIEIQPVPPDSDAVENLSNTDLLQAITQLDDEIAELKSELNEEGV